MRRLWPLLALLLLAAVLLKRTPPPSRTEIGIPRRIAERHLLQEPTKDVPSLGRDPFQYAGTTTIAVPLPPRPTMPLPAANPIPPITLVGFLRDVRGLAAVLSLHGEVALVGSGDSFQGYRVVSLDPDQGVVLQDAEGHEIRLPAS